MGVAGKTCVCGKRALQGRARCASCAREEAERRRMKNARMETPEFVRTREQALSRESACWLCQIASLRVGDVWTVDHVISRADGGSDTLENLRRCHRLCNSRRGGRVVTEELQTQLRRRYLEAR